MTFPFHPQNSYALSFPPRFFILISEAWREIQKSAIAKNKEINAGSRQVADKSLCHFLVCSLNPDAFYSTLFEFLLTTKRRGRGKILQQYSCCSFTKAELWKMGKNQERILTFYLFRITRSYLMEGFFVIRLNWCRIFAKRFPPRLCECLRLCHSLMPHKSVNNIDLKVLKFDGKLHSSLLISPSWCRYFPLLLFCCCRCSEIWSEYVFMLWKITYHPFSEEAHKEMDGKIDG